MSQNSSFFLAADGKYFPYACLAARRVLDVSGNSIPGYILQTGADPRDLDAARQLLGNQVTVIDASAMLEDFEVNAKRLGLAAYLRLFVDRLPEFQSFDRLIYADCDVMFNISIEELARIDLKGALLAAHDDQQYFEMKYRTRLPMKEGAPYFNSGVLVLNMRRIREEGLLEQARQFAQEHRDLCVQHDQDALNVVFEGKWQTMDPRWNAMTNFTDQIRFENAFARHFSWGKPWAGNRLGVEPQALAIYRGLARTTPWLPRFYGAGIQSKLRLSLKRVIRKFDACLGILLGKEKLRRRARYSVKRASAVFGMHAENGMLAVQFPETLIGLN